jgi:hypothetical protein
MRISSELKYFFGSILVEIFIVDMISLFSLNFGTDPSMPVYSYVL